ncbi:RNA polymerase sigma factor [Streptomyces subrutilus]|uniref:DNA-directed RNA polymerase sigma-70 factor n=1 Tax=Streptomyces subrutilus TaxID=36818 RepID=A0A5P2URE2_9ACTN|nr:RNA polymerase sigma factor [Streptomyces subrutilus]QEU81728.1 RNA polymerase sigma factor [Streptomyces subrutilus]WSJ28847.1 RNA polymerase sigma factor [Streptomyces subrutilus]GGZ80318.1 DNA-directed RNA polymerase sigma-70 factor [Streptomyces subrutilus]
MPAEPDPGEADGPGAVPVEDRLLTVRAAEGDEEAFEALVHRYGPRLLRLATRLLGNGGEAEDAVQDAFVSAWRKLPEFRGEAGFGTWIHRIVTNRCLNVLRARTSVADLDTVPEPAAPDHAVSPARAAESHATAEALAAAMAGLSSEQRVCWVLREVEGVPYETIADLVGISQEAVRARVFRARRCLTEAMAAWR